MPIAFVTGASRGVGRGAAAELSAQGFQVFATGRSIASADLPPGVTRIPCDHTNDEQVAAAFAEAGDTLDVLVNCAWGGYERMMEDGKFVWAAPFWEQPAHRWTSMIDAGVRAGFVASQHAARRMIPQGRGLIVNISYWSAQRHLGNAIYGIAHAANDKMTRDLAHELRPHGVSVLSLYPGLVRTERIMEVAAGGWMDISNSESPQFIGRVVAALHNDPALRDRSGSVQIAAQVAKDLGVTDIDGRQPVPLSLETLAKWK